MRKVIAALITFAAIALPQSAIAQTASFTSPHKWTDSATNKSYVFIPGQTPLVAVPDLVFRDQSGEQSMKLNECGWGNIDYFVTLINVARYDQPGFINWSARTTGAAPTCTQNASGASVSNNNSAVGTVVKAGSKYWIKGGTSQGWITLSLLYGKVIKNKANACGFLKLLISDARPMTNFSIGATNYTLATLPAVTKPMICRKVGTSSSTYLPFN